MVSGETFFIYSPFTESPYFTPSLIKLASVALIAASLGSDVESPVTRSHAWRSDPSSRAEMTYIPGALLVIVIVGSSVVSVPNTLGSPTSVRVRVSTFFASFPIRISIARSRRSMRRSAS